MKSFTIETTAKNLLDDLAKHFLIEDRKEFHKPIAEPENTCDFCFKPLTLISDPLIGVEWVCDNRSCPGR
jgi:hypothetical protein